MNYTIYDEIVFLFDAYPGPQGPFHTQLAQEIYLVIQAGKLRNTTDYPQYVNYLGEASFYGHLAELEPTRADAIASKVSLHFGNSLSDPTPIILLTATIQEGETPETSPALAQLAEALLPYVLRSDPHFRIP